MDIRVLAMLIPIIAVMIPIVAILVTPYKQRLRIRERAAARQMYERIAMEKLDVIKTAVAMGYQGDELTQLDARLEKLVGAEKLAVLLDEQQTTVPAAAADLLDADLESELRTIKNLKKARE